MANQESPSKNQKSTPSLIFNDDCSNFFYVYPADKVCAETVDEHVDGALAAGVGRFFCNTNAMRTNYDSEVWEPFWAGYDPDRGDDQEALRGMPLSELPKERALLDSMLALHKQGIDYPQRVLDRCRSRGVSPWVSIRMNDAHDTQETNAPGQSTFWKEHPQYRRVPHDPSARPNLALDYAHPQVRDHYRALIEEHLERYDFDGLELDFMRHQYYFAIGRELEGAKVLTQWLKPIRQLVRKRAEERGHPIKLAVRVASRPNTARRIGLDVATWAREGLVDLVILGSSGYATTTEFDMPVRLWRDLLAPYGVELAGGIEPPTHRYTGTAQEVCTPEMATGSAMAILYGGADAVALFNYFLKFVLARRANWTRQQFEQTLSAMNSVAALDEGPRRHIVNYRETLAPGEIVPRNPWVLATKLGGELAPIEYPLPAVGLDLAFRLQTGPKPVGRDVRVIIGLESDSECDVYRPSVRVNGVPCSAADEKGEQGLFEFTVPEAAKADEEHVVGICGNTHVGGKFLKVTRVEFAVGPQKA